MRVQFFNMIEICESNWCMLLDSNKVESIYQSDS